MCTNDVSADMYDDRLSEKCNMFFQVGKLCNIGDDTKHMLRCCCCDNFNALNHI